VGYLIHYLRHLSFRHLKQSIEKLKAPAGAAKAATKQSAGGGDGQSMTYELLLPTGEGGIVIILFYFIVFQEQWTRLMRNVLRLPKRDWLNWRSSLVMKMFW
jgi:hypothetical protein